MPKNNISQKDNLSVELVVKAPGNVPCRLKEYPLKMCQETMALLVGQEKQNIESGQWAAISYLAD